MMEHKHYHNLESVPKPRPYVLSPAAHFFYLGLVVIGVLTFWMGHHSNPDRIWHSYLINYFYFLLLSLSGLFFLALCYVTTSVWATPLRRIPEAFTAFLPVALILFFILLSGLPSLYEWAHREVVLHDPLLKGKGPYLNLGFFTGRTVFSFLLWMGTAFLLVKNSLKQDKNGERGLTFFNKKLSAPFLVLFGFTFTLTTFDLLMSLEPLWYSTIFGVYCFAGLFESGMAMMILFAIALRRQGAFKEIVNENHLHDLAKLMFAFCVFWAYIAFSQYMLIWYANLPEEIPYMIRRTEGAWTPVALALLFGKFIIPFFLLLSRAAKRNESYLLFVSLWVLAAQWLDVYWMIFPRLDERPLFGWQEVGLFLGFLGLFVLSVTWVLQRVPVYPVKDPWLLEGLNYHQ